jgi:predicted N-acetyltransferase YhbS
MSDAPARTIERLVPALEGAVQRFVLAHPQHGPGHRRELAAVERALGHRECSLVALEGGEVVGYAPLWAVESVHIRMWRVTSLTGAGLVSCGPLVSPALSVSAQRETLQALVGAAKGVAKAEGAHWLRWVLPPVAGGEATFHAAVGGRAARRRAFGARARGLPGGSAAARGGAARGVERHHQARIRKAPRGGPAQRDCNRVKRPRRTLGDFEAVASAFAGHARATIGLGAVRAALRRCRLDRHRRTSARLPLLHVTVALGATPSRRW